MTDSLRECEIAIVVMWPSCPETYSYTCMESYSANAYTISSACAGNVADFVVEHGSGLVLNNEEELIGLFRDKSRLIREVNRFRSGKPGPLDLVDSDEIVDLLDLLHHRAALAGIALRARGLLCIVVERFHDLQHVRVGRILRQAIAAVLARTGLDDACVAQQLRQLDEVVARNGHVLRDIFRGAGGTLRSQVQDGAHTIIGGCLELHCCLLTLCRPACMMPGERPTYICLVVNFSLENNKRRIRSVV